MPNDMVIFNTCKVLGRPSLLFLIRAHFLLQPTSKTTLPFSPRNQPEKLDTAFTTNLGGSYVATLKHFAQSAQHRGPVVEPATLVSGNFLSGKFHSNEVILLAEKNMMVSLSCSKDATSGYE